MVYLARMLVTSCLSNLSPKSIRRWVLACALAATLLVAGQTLVAGGTTAEGLGVFLPILLMSIILGQTAIFLVAVARLEKQYDGSLEGSSREIPAPAPGRLESAPKDPQAEVSEQSDRHHQERLCLALSAAQMHIFEYHPAADRVRCDGSFPQKWDLPPTYTGIEYFLRVHPEDRTGLLIAIHGMLPEQSAYTAEYRLRMADGSYRWLAEQGRGHFDGQGRLVLVLGVCWDVTEGKRNESQLERQAERQALLLEIASSLLQSGRDRNYLAQSIFDRVGPHLEADIGFNFRLDNRDQSLDLVACFGVPPEIRASIPHLGMGQLICGKVAASGQPLVLNEEQIGLSEHADMLRSLGVRAYMCQPLLNRDGNVIGTFSLGSTRRTFFSEAEAEFLQTLACFIALAWERHSAEMEIQRLNMGLERRIEERNAELEASDSDLQGFIYAASHQMKGPLVRIESFGTLLERNCRHRLEDEGLLFLDFIQRNARRLNYLIEDLLAHVQIERKMLDTRPVDLQKVVQQVVDEKKARIEGAGSQLQLDFPLDRVCVQANLHGLAQVLRKLVGNALLYSSTIDDPLVEIGARQEGNCCRLWIRDNGIGFNMAYHDKIFEIFRRLHTYDEFPGSGVGLALVKKAMSRMGGRVWADSAPGRGATFFLELPVAETGSEGIGLSAGDCSPSLTD